MIASELIPDQAAIRKEWEAMRVGFHSLIDSMTEADWSQPNVITRWTNGELLAHILYIVQIFPRQVDAARKGKNMLNLPGFIINPASYLMIRRNARKLDRRTIKIRFDAAYAAGLRAIEAVGVNDWHKGAKFFDQGYRDIETLCHLLPAHVEEHVAQIRRSMRI